jgi:hypothetical protein
MGKIVGSYPRVEDAGAQGGAIRMAPRGRELTAYLNARVGQGVGVQGNHQRRNELFEIVAVLAQRQGGELFQCRWRAREAHKGGRGWRAGKSAGVFDQGERNG